MGGEERTYGTQDYEAGEAQWFWGAVCSGVQSLTSEAAAAPLLCWWIMGDQLLLMRRTRGHDDGDDHDRVGAAKYAYLDENIVSEENNWCSYDGGV